MKNLSIPTITGLTIQEATDQYFKGDPAELHQFLYKNIDAIVRQYESFPDDWRNLISELHEIGLQEFEAVYRPVIDKLRRAETAESLKELKQIQNKLVSDSIFYERHYFVPWLSDPDSYNYSYSYTFLEWDGRKYLIVDEAISYFILNPLSSIIQNLETIVSQNQNSARPAIFDGIQWKGDKTDLAELIKGLAGMDVIHKDGKRITEKDLKPIFEFVFDETIAGIAGLIKPRYEKESGANKETFLFKADRKVRQYIQGIRNKQG